MIGYSGDTLDYPRGPCYYDAFWAELNDDSVSVYRHADDILADQFRLRLWQWCHHLHLPLVMHHYP